MSYWISKGPINSNGIFKVTVHYYSLWAKCTKMWPLNKFGCLSSLYTIYNLNCMRGFSFGVFQCTNPLWIECFVSTYPGGGYSTLSWVRMCGPKFRTPPYNKTREDANLLPISKPFVSLRALFKTNQCFLQCKLRCISTFWQPVDKPKDKFIGNYAFCKNATYIKTNFQIKKGPLQNLRARKSTLSGPHIPVPTFPLSTPPGTYVGKRLEVLGARVIDPLSFSLYDRTTCGILYQSCVCLLSSSSINYWLVYKVWKSVRIRIQLKG